MNPDRIIEMIAANVPLFAVIATAYWWATPRMLKSALQNGSGEIVRRIVRDENAHQTLGLHERISALEGRLAGKGVA